jgi:hypothetical protein
MTKKIFEWELNLARRLAMISIAGGFASWLFRVLRQGFIPDFLGIFLSAFILCLAALLFMRVGYRVLAATLITGMMIIGLQVSWGLIEPRSGPMLVLIAGVALSAAYYRFRIAFLVILASAAALSLMGYSAADRLPGQPVFLPNGLTVFTNFISASIGYVSGRYPDSCGNFVCGDKNGTEPAPHAHSAHHGAKPERRTRSKRTPADPFYRACF